MEKQYIINETQLIGIENLLSIITEDLTEFEQESILNSTARDIESIKKIFNNFAGAFSYAVFHWKRV